MPRNAQFGFDVLLSLILTVLPKPFGWSRRSSRVLFLAGGMTLVLGSITLISDQFISHLTTRRRELAGVFLLAAQYQLSEEESSVRGAVAVVGVGLIVIGTIARQFGPRRVMSQDAG